jgi:replication factor C subunit 2/4
MALARELLGESFKKATLELNASDDRGLDTVRDKIKSFAAQKVPLPEGKHKIIILDEADSMTESAQQALRIIISDFSHTTRFALACNDSTKIIEPIQSRCNILRYSKLKNDEIKERLLKVVSIEKINYEDEGLKDLIDTAEGDMRYALNNLQSTFVGFGMVTHENVYKIVDIPKPEFIRQIFFQTSAGNLDQALDIVDELLTDGYNSFDIINVLIRHIQDTGDITDELRLELLKEASITKMRFLDGIDSVAQIYGFIAEIASLLLKK